MTSSPHYSLIITVKFKKRMHRSLLRAWARLPSWWFLDQKNLAPPLSLGRGWEGLDTEIPLLMAQQLILGIHEEKKIMFQPTRLTQIYLEFYIEVDAWALSMASSPHSSLINTVRFKKKMHLTLLRAWARWKFFCLSQLGWLNYIHNFRIRVMNKHSQSQPDHITASSTYLDSRINRIYLFSRHEQGHPIGDF